MTDPIGDMLTRIRNAQAVGHETVQLPFSAMKWSLAQLLVREGFLEASEKKGRIPKRTLVLTLKFFPGKKPAIEGMRRVSKPGRRMFVGAQEITRVKQGYGVAVISTTKGLITDREARLDKIGGEVVCEVW